MNTQLKKVKVLLPAIEIDMGGFPVKQALPTQQVNQVDPFLLLHHGQAKYNANRPARHQGIGPHPHRGFSPVTFVIEGELHHRDSRGNNQIAKKGEAQWMHAGAGIVHSERPSEAATQSGKMQEFIQFWVNTPKDKKMVQPSYHFVPENEIPVFESVDKKVNSKLIAGEYNGLKGKFPTQSELLIIWGKSEENSTEIFTIPDGFNTMFYVVKGEISMKGYGLIEAENLAILGDEGDTLEIHFKQNTEFILFSGQPLNEKLAQHGPFVMNTQTELLEAMRNYQMGKMGVLIEDEMD